MFSRRWCRFYSSVRSSGLLLVLVVAYFMPSQATAATCKTGEYYDSANSTCKLCPVGFYCVSDQKYACYVGSYQDKTGQVDCKLCEEGTFQSLQGKTSCQPCPGNTFSRRGFSQCQKCPAPAFCLVLNRFGQCANGKTTCVKGKQVCEQKTLPSVEVCDGKDNDCDGIVDENLKRVCTDTNNIGTCKGTQTCDVGRWLPCNAVPATNEACDNNDNDCDGQIDEGLSRACDKTNTLGSCTGTETCKAGKWVGCNAPTPVKEVCNNKDDNCNGTIDENLQRSCKAPGSVGTGCTGLETCSAGKWGNCNAQTPLPETCNGSDDDCDGKIDENLTRPCKQTNPDGTCTGKEYCNNGAWGGCDARIPTFETCNGIDDNCDGKTDENLRRQCYVDNAYGSCAGHKECVKGKYTPCDARAPQKEACNGKDDDCDGSIDEYEDGPCPGFQVCVKKTCVECATDKHCRTQGRPACEPTKNTCEVCATNAHCPKGTVCFKNDCVECGQNNDCPRARPYCVGQRCFACADKKPPGVEVCDGQDNNCNGAVDENLRRACVLKTDNGQCSGQETCDNGKWGLCSAPKATDEVCNGRDDDCDGRTDNQPNSYRVLIRDCKGPCGKKGLEFCVGGLWKGCTGVQECQEPVQPEPAREPKAEVTDSSEPTSDKVKGVDDHRSPDVGGGLDLSIPKVGCQCQSSVPSSGWLWLLCPLFLLGLRRLQRRT